MEGATAHDVKVNVKDRLPGARHAVHDGAIPALGYFSLPGKIPGAKQHVPDQLRVGVRQVVECCDVAFRNDEKVHRRNRANILKGNQFVVFKHDLRRDLALDYLTEYTVCHAEFPLS